MLIKTRLFSSSSKILDAKKIENKEKGLQRNNNIKIKYYDLQLQIKNHGLNFF